MMDKAAGAMAGEAPRLSVSGARWVMAPQDPRAAAALVEETGMPQALANVLAGRGIARDAVAGFLDPKLRDLLPDPDTLTDMQAATARLAKAVEAGETIGIFGDYDVDGACSAALFHDMLTALGCAVHIHIPDRFTEGYGLNLDAMLELKAKGCTLLVAVDCGITATAPVAGARDAGLDVIIIDHHIPGPELPDAVAVVNPNRLEDDGSLGMLAAAGVCFLVMVGLRRRLREAGVFGEEQPEPDLMEALDLVALATIADVVPLTGLNRAFVRQGLYEMAKRNRPGPVALADSARLTAPPDVHALGFILGPRINAGGRLGSAELGARIGVELLIAADRSRAEALAIELEELNTKRREIDAEVTAEAIAQFEGVAEDALPAFVMAVGEGWHEGVLGIAASRLREHTGRPAAVVSMTRDAESGKRIGKASARSIAPFKLGDAVLAATQKGLLVAGGGHAMAAGFTLDGAQEAAFRDFMIARADKAYGGAAPEATRHIDTALAAGHCDTMLLDWYDRAGPWGTGFAEPVLLLAGVEVEGLRSMGKEGSHRGLRLSDATGSVEAVAFNVAGKPLGDALARFGDGAGGGAGGGGAGGGGGGAGGGKVDAIGYLRRNTYGGRNRAQFVLVDLREHNP